MSSHGPPGVELRSSTARVATTRHRSEPLIASSPWVLATCVKIMLTRSVRTDFDSPLTILNCTISVMRSTLSSSTNGIWKSLSSSSPRFSIACLIPSKRVWPSTTWNGKLDRRPR